MLDNKPSVETLLKAFRMFDQHGLIKEDLCFDPEHFMETVILPHWCDVETPGIDAGDEVVIEFFSYIHPLNNSIATFIRTNTETGTKMAEVIDELGDERKVPMFNKIIKEETECEGKLVEVPSSVFWGSYDSGTSLAKIVCACKVPSLHKEGYLVTHAREIYGRRFVEAKDVVFIP